MRLNSLPTLLKIGNSKISFIYNHILDANGVTDSVGSFHLHIGNFMSKKNKKKDLKKSTVKAKAKVRVPKSSVLRIFSIRRIMEPPVDSHSSYNNLLF